ncbi:MAG: hypothetical protein IIC80_03545, partial [Chloroflexi bacterium]|nr:hypothetical protein [Chloroflexota bacterium]
MLHWQRKTGSLGGVLRMIGFRLSAILKCAAARRLAALMLALALVVTSATPAFASGARQDANDDDDFALFGFSPFGLPDDSEDDFDLFGFSPFGPPGAGNDDFDLFGFSLFGLPNDSDDDFDLFGFSLFGLP